MNDAVPRHPEAQTMAAFIEGTLSRGEVAAVAEHLKGCGECRMVVSETARFEREEERRDTRSWWLAAAAILAAIVVALPFAIRTIQHRSSSIAPLIAAARDHRLVEGRLSDFPHARLQAPSRGEAKPDTADLKLRGAAGEVLEATADRKDSDSDHAQGVACLVIGRTNDGIAALERAAARSDDPKMWNDLAAARLASAIADEHPSQLPEALADVDRALRLDPNLPEARFNRALILEHLGVYDQARKAWQHYLDLDNSSGWSVEARAHLQALSKRSSRFDKKLIETAPADALVREFPEDARRWGEAILLAQWADGDEKSLARARAIGEALAASNGEQLRRDAVAAIDRSTAATRAALVEAHKVYSQARRGYSERNAGAAETQLRRASELFRQGGSPMAEVASYYAASAAFDQHRARAREELQQLLSRVDGDRYRALAANIEWELAVAANAEGDWGEAAREADRGAATLHRLGERGSAAFVEGVGAIAYEMMGERDLAWSRRASTYAELSRSGASARLNTMLHTATITLVPLDRIAAASALVDLILDDGPDDALIRTASLATRARLAIRANDDETARRAIADARLTSLQIRDKAVREPYTALVDIAEAASDASGAPQNTVSEIDRTLPLLSGGRLGRLLPDAYLQRGRAHRALGDRSAALADYRAALQEIEKQNAAIHDDEQRFDFLDTAAQIVDETVDLQLTHGDVAGALDTVDRVRSRSAHVSGNHSPPVMPNDVAMIEYLVRPKGVTLFCISRDRLSAYNIAIDRGELMTHIDAFAEHIRQRAPLDQIHRDGAVLYQWLFEPVKRHFGSVTDIVIVPDERLYSIPFGALWDDEQHRYLVEQYVIRFATTARRAPAAAESASMSPAIVISDPPAMHAPRLLASRDEASRIATLQGAVLLAGEMATRARFLELAPASALIHFAGHANSDAAESYGALLFASGNGDSGVLSSGEIARLALVHHPLVVLAACGTFRGNAAHVAGMSSLARSFLTAGARGVVGTLWEIDDDVSARLFTRFHERLRAGASPARSLHDAQVDALRSQDPRVAHPATWSPVELVGNV